MPQFRGSTSVLAQLPEQHCSPTPPQLSPQAPQLALVPRVTQDPPQQAWLDPQLFPQPPQWLTLVSVSTHDVPPQQLRPPVHAGLLPHMQVPSAQVSPVAHAGVQSGAPQTPALQTWPAPQTLPQLPQFAASVWVSAHPVPQQVFPPVQAAPPAHRAVTTATSRPPRRWTTDGTRRVAPEETEDRGS